MTVPTIELVDPAGGSRALVAPTLGFNCYSFQVPRDGALREVLWTHPEFLSGGRRPSGSGIPLLFPFAGRIRGTSFRWEGRDYALEPGDGMGNAIHGFVLSRAWRVIEQSPSRVQGAFQASCDDPSLLERWPADFSLSVSYEVEGAVLRSVLRVENHDRRLLPFALATHAYFRLPVGGVGEREDTIVTVPASSQWELAELRPTGRILGLEPLDELPEGMRLAGHTLDNVLTGLEPRGGRVTTSVRSGDGSRAVVQTFDEAFRHAVVYTPPHREAICMEPYTCVPDPFALGARGIETGLRLLPPGERFETTIEIRMD